MEFDEDSLEGECELVDISRNSDNIHQSTHSVIISNKNTEIELSNQPPAVESSTWSDSEDSRFSFEQAYKKWAGTHEEVLPAKAVSEIQFTNISKWKGRGRRRASVHERLYQLGSVYDNHKKELAKKYAEEQERQVRESSVWLRSQARRRRSHSVGSRSTTTTTTHAVSQNSNKLTDTSPAYKRLEEWQVRRDVKVRHLRHSLQQAREEVEQAELTFQPSLRRSFSATHLPASNSRSSSKSRRIGRTISGDLHYHQQHEQQQEYDHNNDYDNAAHEGSIVAGGGATCDDVFERLHEEKEVMARMHLDRIRAIELELEREEQFLFVPRIPPLSRHLAEKQRARSVNSRGESQHKQHSLDHNVNISDAENMFESSAPLLPTSMIAANNNAATSRGAAIVGIKARKEEVNDSFLEEIMMSNHLALRLLPTAGATTARAAAADYARRQEQRHLLSPYSSLSLTNIPDEEDDEAEDIADENRENKLVASTATSQQQQQQQEQEHMAREPLKLKSLLDPLEVSSIGSDISFAKPSYYKAQVQIRKTTPTVPKIYETLYRDEARKKHMAELEAKYYPPDYHTPNIYSRTGSSSGGRRTTATRESSSTSTRLGKDVFERLWNDPAKRRGRAELLQRWHDVGAPADVRLTRDEEEALIGKLYAKDMARRVNRMTQQQQRKEEQAARERDPFIMPKKSRALVYRKRYEALAEIFDTLVWSAQFMKTIQQQQKLAEGQGGGEGLEAEHPALLSASKLGDGGGGGREQWRYKLHGSNNRSLIDNNIVDYEGEDQVDVSMYPLDLSQHLIDAEEAQLAEGGIQQQPPSVISPLTSPERFHAVAEKFRVRFNQDGSGVVPLDGLHTSLANAGLLQPPVLAQVMEEILENIRPVIVSKKDFIFIVEALLKTGYFPPLNGVLCSTREINEDVPTIPRDSMPVSKVSTRRSSLLLARIEEIPSTSLSLSSQQIDSHIGDVPIANTVAHITEIKVKREGIELQNNREEQAPQKHAIAATKTDDATCTAVATSDSTILNISPVDLPRKPRTLRGGGGSNNNSPEKPSNVLQINTQIATVTNEELESSVELAQLQSQE